MTTPDQQICGPLAPVKAEQLPLTKKLTIKVLGVGGAGCNAVQSVAQSGMEGMEYFALNTDAQSLEGSSTPNKFVLGARRTRGLGTGGDPEMGRVAAEDDRGELRAFCADTDIIFILAGLGGGTGTGASPVIAQIAKESGALVLAVVTLPFDFEGGRRQRQAQLGLQRLKAEADAVICLPNEKLFKLIDEKTSVLEGFKISNRLVAQGVHGVWRLLTTAGLINVDFSDLCSVTRGRHAESSFAAAEASGETRIEQVMERLMTHPLLDGGLVLNESDAVLVSLVGGPDLSMSEVNRLMAQINRQCENAHMIFGAAIDPTFANRILVTLIASHHQSENSRPMAQLPMEVTPRQLAPATSETSVSASEFLDHTATERSTSRFVGPAPAMSEEGKAQMYQRQGSRTRKKNARLQRELPLEIVSKGRFEKSEPTVMNGEDLDVPTYIRRGVALN